MSIDSDKRALKVGALVTPVIIAATLLWPISQPKPHPCQDTEPRVLIERLHRALGPDAYLVEYSKQNLDNIRKALIIAGEDNSQDTVNMSRALIDVFNTLENISPIVKKYVKEEGADDRPQ